MFSVLTDSIAGPTGQPFSRRTLDHLQKNDGIFFQALLGMVGDPPIGVAVILWGCDVSQSGNTYTVSPGVAIIDRELVRVPFHSVTIPGGQVPTWQITTEYAPGDPVILTNGAAVNIHQDRPARLTATDPANPAGFPLHPSGTRYYLRAWADGGRTTPQPAWITVPTPAGTSAPPVSGYFAPFSYRRATDGMVRLRGALSVPSGASTLLLTLPPGYRPSARVQILVGAFISTNYFAVCEVQATGEVYINVGGSAGNTHVVSFDAIAFLAEN